ncbi:ferric-dicitrate binding protein FerR, regulates iron transport through sigma-19 [Algoriphagus locisalis]|uniref:Ferric-dicitrate binding protein FerR, regulates iron transport through sigma-19 n=1 Tax=Algoriphagus locisalis TaxID=305507 RepID=A0A1I7CGJ9_9BACT|nr:FecR domain-containing protein [Algoriphagus locisalis]SFT98539.1 ferric-dicitrate binding protein FerR, regulates iron transport through sigma-19 [Algoriphagus locisalis]
MRLPSALLDIVSKILRGKASKEEIQKFNTWYTKGIDSVWHIQDHKKRNKAQVESEMLQNIRKATCSRIPDSSTKQSFLGWKVAASIIILIGIGLFAIKGIPSDTPAKQEAKLLTFENGKGMIKKVRLPDGSTVSLFHDTKIQVAESFSENRLVKLSGEAFFEVKRDTLRPFRVETATLTTEVLGTSFLIRNQPEQQEVVAVKTGLVKVSDPTDSIFMLTPNLRLDYSDQGGTVSTIPKSDPLFAWTEDIIVFENTDMKEMVKTLEEWYGVKITTDLTASNSCQISGTYEKQSLENLLQLIQYSIPMTYEIAAKDVTLTFKNCP